MSSDIRYLYIGAEFNLFIFNLKQFWIKFKFKLFRYIMYQKNIRIEYGLKVIQS